MQPHVPVKRGSVRQHIFSGASKILPGTAARSWDSAIRHEDRAIRELLPRRVHNNSTWQYIKVVRVFPAVRANRLRPKNLSSKNILHEAGSYRTLAPCRVCWSPVIGVRRRFGTPAHPDSRTNVVMNFHPSLSFPIHTVHSPVRSQWVIRGGLPRNESPLFYRVCQRRATATRALLPSRRHATLF